MRLHHACRICVAAVLAGAGCTAGRAAPEAHVRLDTLNIYAPADTGMRRPCTFVPDSSSRSRTLRCDAVQPDTTPRRG